MSTESEFKTPVEFEANAFNAIDFETRFIPSKEVLDSIRFIPRGEPDTFGATPLDCQATSSQQIQLLERLQKLVDKDVDVSIPASIREYMKDTLSMRFWGRATANYDKYATALRTADEFIDEPDAYAMIVDSLIGHASPAELLLVSEMLGTSGIELGCASIPYGKRIEEVSAMRAAVRTSVEALGGTPLEDQPLRYIVRGIMNAPMWQSEQIEGFLMTRKRNIGIMPDGTIIRERTSFILRADIAGTIPESNIAAIQALDPEAPNWRADVVTAGGLDEIATDLLEADEFTLAIPVSCTIYAFNEAREAEIIRRKKAKRDAQIGSLAGYPLLQADREQLIIAQENGNTRDSKGMLLKPIVFPFGEEEIKDWIKNHTFGGGHHSDVELGEQ